MTNPEVLRKTAESGGENLLRGLVQFVSPTWSAGAGKLQHQA